MRARAPAMESAPPARSQLLNRRVPMSVTAGGTGQEFQSNPSQPQGIHGGIAGRGNRPDAAAPIESTSQTATGEQKPPGAEESTAPAPESAEAPKPSLIQQAKEMLQAEALKPDGKFSLLNDMKIVELADAQVARDHPDLAQDKGSDAYKAAVKTVTDALVAQNGQNRKIQEYIRPPQPDALSPLQQVNDRGERQATRRLKDESTGEIVEQPYMVNETAHIQQLLNQMGGEGTALAAQIDQTKKIPVKVGGTTHMLTRDEYLAMERDKWGGKTADQKQALRDEATADFNLRALVDEQPAATTQKKDGSSEGGQPKAEKDQPKAPEKQLSKDEQNVRNTLRHDLGELYRLARSDRKKYGRLFREVSEALSNEGIFGNDARLEALKKVKELYIGGPMKRPAISADKGSEAETAIANHRANIDTAIGYLEGTGAGQADAIQRLIQRHYGNEIPKELQELANMENVVTRAELLQSLSKYRLDQNNKRIEYILASKGEKKVEGHQDFIGYVLRADGGELLKQMQAIAPELVQGPIDSEAQSLRAEKAIEQLRIPIRSDEERDRWRNHLQELMFGEEEDRGTKKILGLVTFETLMAAVSQLGVLGVGSPEQAFQQQQPGYG